jgi:hypothetical protein
MEGDREAIGEIDLVSDLIIIHESKKNRNQLLMKINS